MSHSSALVIKEFSYRRMAPFTKVFPDWLNNDTAEYWNNEFAEFFDAETGVDIDGLWIGKCFWTHDALRESR
jgi:hypothetical protein